MDINNRLTNVLKIFFPERFSRNLRTLLSSLRLSVVHSSYKTDSFPCLFVTFRGLSPIPLLLVTIDLCPYLIHILRTLDLDSSVIFVSQK